MKAVAGIFKNSAVLTTLLVVVVVGGGYGGFQYYQSRQEINRLKQNPQAETQAEVKKLTELVGKLMELPQETPTVATVTDKSKLKDQPFFARAQNGDKVLIYTQARKAILYSPKLNKVIDVAPVNIGQTQPASQVRVALYNGTQTVGLTNTVEKDLKDKINNVDVVAKQNAGNNTYQKSVVVDLTGGKQKQAAEQLAKVLGASVGPLPEGEEKPEDVDLLVILGEKPSESTPSAQ